MTWQVPSVACTLDAAVADHADSAHLHQLRGDDSCVDMQLLRYACEHSGPLAVESASLHLSRMRGRYVSAREALGELKHLELAGLLQACAVEENAPRSFWPTMLPTAAGLRANGHGLDVDALAWQLRERS
jgi:hypothetical protein